MTHTAWIVLACFIGSATAAPQPQNPAEDAPSQDSSTTKSEKPERPTSLQLLVPNILHDQKPIWTFPLKVAEGKHWKPLLGITLATVGQPYFRNTSGFSTYKTGPLRGRNTTLAITLTPVAFYLTGLAKYSRHSQNTALLAAEGIADTQLLSLLMKHIDGRLTAWSGQAQDG